MADDTTIAKPATEPSRFAVVRWVLRQRARSLAVWMVAIGAVSAIYASFYDLMDMSELETLIQGMPEGLVTALGYDAIGSAAGYLESTVFGLLGPLLLFVFGLGMAARVLAGGEEDGTLELELTHPVSRRQVLLERYLALASGVAALSAVVWLVVTVVAAAVAMDLAPANLAAAALGLLLVGLALATITFAVGAVTGRRTIALAVGSSVAVASYLTNALAPMLDNPKLFESISPMSWYLAGEPLQTGIDIGGYLALIALTIVSLGIAIIGFERRDLGV